MNTHRGDTPPELPTGLPRVSVILPAFNAAEYLMPAVEHLLGQTLSDLEIVLVDDGSTDATALLGARLAGSDPRVHYFRLERNSGVACARAFGVRQSRGEFVWFVDADDAAPPAAAERMLAAARATGADTVIGSAEVITRGGGLRTLAAPKLPGPVSGTVAFTALLTGQITGHLWNKLIRRSVVDGIDFTPAQVHSDLAMMGQLLIGSRTVTSISEVVYRYRLRSGSIVTSARPRNQSLQLLETAFVSAARRAGPEALTSREFRYFIARYIVLSGIKDAVLSRYESGERRRLLHHARKRISWRTVSVLCCRGDWRRLLLAITAKWSLPVYRRLLTIADSR